MYAALSILRPVQFVRSIPQFGKNKQVRHGLSGQFYRDIAITTIVMNRFLVLPFFISCQLISSAQTRISGKVTDIQGKPVPGANVVLAGTYDGASTSADGIFTFSTAEKGPHALQVSAVSFQNAEVPVVVDVSAIEIEFVLEESVTELDEVTISAGAFTAGDENRRTLFRSMDIATTAGATADIAGALNTLPGTNKVGETGRLFVRGGDDAETRSFVDGMVVLDAYSPAAPGTPSRGRFLPFMFKGTSFSTGGYSAEYGQALSSVLALNTKDEDPTTRTDIGIMSVGGDIAHTQAWKHGSAAAKAQYTNLQPYMNLVEQEKDWISPPISSEVSGVVRQRFGEKGIIKFFGNANESKFSLYEHEIAQPANKHRLDLSNRYRYGNLSFQGILSEHWSLRTGLSYNTSDYDNLLESSSLKERGKGLHIKSAVEWEGEKTSIRFGTEVIDRDYQAAWSQPQAGTLVQGFRETISAGWAETDIKAFRKFITRVGLRAEYNGLAENASLDPRVSLARKLGEGQISLAYGRFRQSPQTQWYRVNPKLHAEKAEHIVLNYQVIRDSRTFRAEVYFKCYSDLVKFKQPLTLSQAPFSPIVVSLNNLGKGYARGAEVFWRDNKSIRHVDYWISYSYLDTEREYLYFPASATPSFASAHNFSIVYKHFIPKLKTQAGLTLSVASPRPYHDPNRPGFMQGRTPLYQDLSMNLSYLPSPSVIVHFSCTNVLGYDNIFGYQFSPVEGSEGSYAGSAIRQPAPRFLFLAVFITLSKNKTVNQLPSL